MSDIEQIIPWNEKISILSINPDVGTREDIARLASELMECKSKLINAREMLNNALEEISK